MTTLRFSAIPPESPETFAPVYTQAPSFIATRPPPTKGELLLVDETEGVGVDFTDIGPGQPWGSMQIKDLADPTHNFIASAFDGPDPFDRFVFSRSTIGTCFNEFGEMVQLDPGQPRFDYDPATLLPRGLLIEPPSKNLCINSKLDGTPAATQTITIVTPGVHYISFYGTGMVTPSGVGYSGGAIVGSAWPARTVFRTNSLTAGSLTLTISGTVTHLQCEYNNGFSGPTSFIPSGASGSITRAYDSVRLPTSLFRFNQEAGTIYVKFMLKGYGTPGNNIDGQGNDHVFWAGGSTDYIDILHGGNSIYGYIEEKRNGQTADFTRSINNSPIKILTPKKLAYAYATNDVAGCGDANTPIADNTRQPYGGVYSNIYLGRNSAGSLIMNGWMQAFKYVSYRDSNTHMQNEVL
jgi:hypothetical protein